MRIRSVVPVALLLAVGACSSSAPPPRVPVLTTTTVTTTSVTSSTPSTTSTNPTVAPSTPATTPIITAPPPTTGTAPTADLAQLTSSTWNAVSRITVGGLQPLPTGASFTIDASGHIVINTGCNTGRATVTVDGPHSFVVGRVQYTDLECGGEPATLDATVVANFSGGVTWNLDGDTLTVVPTYVTDVGIVFTRAD